jgi:hypothetical protein
MVYIADSSNIENFEAYAHNCANPTLAFMLWFCGTVNEYRSADKSLARPGRKQATATEDFYVHISYL